MSSGELYGRWGIFGGRFDPIHNGHLTLASDCKRLKSLDGILFVPSFRPPHKPGDCQASFDERLEMVRLALGNSSWYACSDIEREIEGPGYSLRVVRKLKRRYEKTSFVFIIGADNIADLRNWHNPAQLAREVPIVAGARPGFCLEAEVSDIDVPVDLILTSEVNVSGAAIRASVGAGAGYEELAALVPPAVASFIIERKLYRA